MTKKTMLLLIYLLISTIICICLYVFDSPNTMGWFIGGNVLAAIHGAMRNKTTG